MHWENRLPGVTAPGERFGGEGMMGQARGKAQVTSAFVALFALLVGVCPALCQSTEDPKPLSQAVAQPTFGEPRQYTPAEPAARPLVPSVGQLFGEIGQDFRNLPSKSNITLLVIGSSLALLGDHDRSISDSLAGNGALHETLEPGQFVGGFAFQAGAAVLTYAIGRATDKPRVARVGADLIRAQVLSQTVTQTIKFAAGRTRPDGSNDQSFPSGHTSSSFATATVLQRHFGWKVGVPAFAAAAYVAASRVQMQKHYFTDVAFGAIVGIIAGRTVTLRIGGERFTLAPMAAPGGAGIALTRVSF